MTDQPEFIDNRRGNTLAAAITTYLQGLDDKLAADPTLDVVTGYFNPRGYFAIADGLERVEHLRLLIGAEPEEEGTERWRKPGEPRAAAYDRSRIEEALARLDANLAQDRDLLGFSREVDAKLQGMVDVLDSDRVEVRRHTEDFVHGKAFIFSDQEGVVAGSSNLTGAGLTSNLELNLGVYQPHVTGQVQTWFEDLWAESEPFDLASLYAQRFEPYDPYLIYLRVLHARYGDELADADRAEGIGLTSFQEDGVTRAQRFLDEHGGVIIADEVGLGKTYIAGELLYRYVHDRRQRALVIAPAYLRDGMWARKPAEWGIQFETISYAQLRDDRQLGGQSNNLALATDEYQLVVIDEAHAFRNPSTQQAEALRQLLRGDPPKDVVLLTATPVNNSLWDLYYQLGYFIKNDAAFAHTGIPSLRERFNEAQARDPAELTPDILFDVLDETTVRRTRRFIKQRYAGATMPDDTGEPVRITFPEQQPEWVEYEFVETFGDAYFEDIEAGLAGDAAGERTLTLARYRPSYYLTGEEDASELSLAGLLRSGLLKRFESSSYAFQNTLNRMIEQNRTALELLDAGYLPDADAIGEWMETDSDEAWDELLAHGGAESLPAEASADGLQELQAAIETDIAILERWSSRAQRIDHTTDEKLQALGETLRTVVERAEEDARRTAVAGDEAEAFRQKRKVLIFSYYEDTVDWIYEYLAEVVAADPDLACYAVRIAAVGGTDAKHGVSRERAVHGFAPDSGDAPPDTEDRFDILVTTDVLGQGVNLQQARTVINYDLPWNPMRVVQRNGRIDRVNSPHDVIYPITFFPEDRLDALLELEKRVRIKLTQAARVVGVDAEIFPDVERLERTFADKRETIERLQAGDPAVFDGEGRQAAAYSGEEYRQELREGLERHGERVTSLPWAAGSGFVGERPGTFFCARVGEEVFMRFVPRGWPAAAAGEDALVRETLACLRIIECTEDTPRVLPDAAKDAVYAAWETAQADIYAQWQEQTDPQNVEPSLRKVFREVGAHLQAHWPDNRTQTELEETVAAVEAPWPRRYERELRAVFTDERLGPIAKSEALIETIADLGLQPYEAPEPLPELVDAAEVKLVCWMAIVGEEGR